MRKIALLFLPFFCLNIISSQTEVKFNLATAPLLIPNVGIEIKTSDRKSFQLDVLGSFWDSFDGKPLHITQAILEHRWYNKRLSLFFGINAGYGMFTLQKPSWPVIYDQYQDPSTYAKGGDSYQSGRIAFYGITVGYKKLLSEHWALEFFIGGGLTQSNYKGYTKVDDDIVQYTPNDDRFNGSGEFTLYRGGIMLVYKISD